MFRQSQKITLVVLSTILAVLAVFVRTSLGFNLSLVAQAGIVAIVYLLHLAFIDKAFSTHSRSIETPVTPEQVHKIKTDFVNIAAHQLRTPASIVSWHAEMLLDSAAGPLNKAQTSYVKTISDGNHQMIERINLLLNTARLELHTFLIDPQDTDIRALVYNVSKELAHVGAKKKIAYTENIAKNVPKTLLADSKALTIILKALLNNAYQYTPDGGGKVSLHISIKNRRQLSVEVTDTGIGIEKENYKNIFTKLFRADEARKTYTNGSGLALYNLRLLVALLNGTIAFHSKAGQGTTFAVMLPLEKLETPYTPEPEPLDYA